MNESTNMGKIELRKIKAKGKRIASISERLASLTGDRWTYQYVLEDLLDLIEDMSETNLERIGPDDGDDESFNHIWKACNIGSSMRARIAVEDAVVAA